MSAMDVNGKVVVVTGAARGLGAELARQLTAKGARVALLGLEPTVLPEVSGRLPGSAWWEVDVTDGAALSRVAAEVEQRLGPADVVIANAGIATGGPLLLADPGAYDRVIEVNLLGSIRTVRAFLPQVVRTKGYVLQVASMAALVPGPMMSAYCASKSGAEAFGHSLRGEVRHHGVDVGVAYLSWTDTDMVRGGDAVEGIGERRSKLPGVLGRTYPVEPAVARMVDGIAARAPHVYAQKWIRTVMYARALLPSVTARPPKKQMREAERAVREAGPAATLPVGAGGQADLQRS
ncbi:MAG: SDR family oxidoreductase [Actinobacteria bacterium]|nr:SDR family oxidoreductase [Actinomycetota bacterium]MCA1719646.1 SDR family oxidoreductase [Actinomycetota bacterium]